MAARTRAARGGTTLLLAVLLSLGTSVSAHATTRTPQSAPLAGAVARDEGGKAKKKAPAPARRHYRPWDSTWFNYPFSPSLSDRFRIRHQIRTAITRTPPRSRIRLATFSFDDDLIADDLIRAHRRGVRVEVLVSRMKADLPSFKRLQRGLAQKRPKGVPRVGHSYARPCIYSCRGTRGLLHSKLYLFSHVGRARWVTMLGSANLTRFAAVGQWNHLDTFVGEEEYRHFAGIFKQMRRDRPKGSVQFTTKKMHAWIYPRKSAALAKDPMARALRSITCTWHGKSGKLRRTSIRIAMYAWFDDRGNNLARLVRRKWDRGCNVWVNYAVTNGTVLRILGSPTGRGAIPVRRTATTDSSGEVVEYNHSKYVAVYGRYRGERAQLVWTGSINWTDLGRTSDELLVRLRGTRVYRAYLTNFNRVWHGPVTH